MAGRRGEPVDLTGEEDMSEDEALRYAIELSMQDQEKDSKEEPEKKSSSFGSLILDRKAMEEERLKRLAAKRPRDASGIDHASAGPPPKRKATEASAKPEIDSKVVGKKHEVVSATEARSPLHFPAGAVRKTWAYGYPRTGDDIKIEEVLQKDQLELAVLSSYQWDDEWMLSKIDFPRTKLLLVAYAKDEEQVWGQANSAVQLNCSLDGRC